MNLISLADPLRRRPLAGYGLAGVAVVAAYLLRLGIDGPLASFPLLLPVVAVTLVAFFAGTGPAVATALASALVARYGFGPADLLAASGRHGLVALFFYGVLDAIIILLIRALFEARALQATSEAALRALNAQLEVRIVERSTALEAEMADRITAQAQLHRMQKMESIGQLSGGIAHDFNNMLAIVIGSLDLARRRLGEGESDKATDLIDNAAEGARRAAVLTQRLLAYSRRQALSPQSIDANKLVASMSELLRRAIGEQVRVETVLAGGLWRTFADASQLEHAVVNLAVNARDAMPEGGKLTIETANIDLDDRYARAHAEVDPGQYVMICVTDTGMGMPAEALQRAFDPFFTTKTVGKGTGLGLSQVYGYVKQSGGHVKIYSELGRGTTVKIYLPRHPAEGDAVTEERPSRSTPIPVAAADRVVLVVEDEAQVRQMTSDALRELGYAVIEAEGGEQALAALRRQRIDVLFTDIVMPGINGRQLADLVRADHPDIRVLFTTGYTRNAVVHNGLLDIGVAFLPKPFTVEQLARKIDDVLADRGANRPA